MVSHNSFPGVSSASTPTHNPRKELEIGMAHAHGTCSTSGSALAWSTEQRGKGECHRHAATINILPDEIFLKIFYICLHDRFMDYFEHHKGEWQRLVHVCRRWRQIIYESPRYLDLLLYCSKGTHARNLSCWPAFPITMIYRCLDDEDDVIALLKHSDRVCFISLYLTSSQLGKVVAAMQETFPVLTHLDLTASEDLPDEQVLPGGFLGGSSPSLQLVQLTGIPFPDLPTLLLSSRDFVSLHIDKIPPNGCISPEAMIAGLAALTRLQTLRFVFQFGKPFPEQRTRHLDPQMRIVLPALTEFAFWGHREYLEDLVAQFDAPRLDNVDVFLVPLDTLWLPRLSLFIARTETLRFSHARVEFSNQTFKIVLGREFDPYQPRLSLSASFEWWGTHVDHVSHVLGQMFAMFSDVGHLHIRVGQDHQGWQVDIDSIEWLTFFHLFPTVKILHVSGSFAGQVAYALEDIPEEMATEVFPSLLLLMFEDDDRPVESTEQFQSLRQLNGHPVMIVDLETVKLDIRNAYHHQSPEKRS
jgi:hypothetical protein